jgi:hypothetical protein
MVTRTCTVCGETKAGSEFYRGHNSACKPCERARVIAAKARRRAVMGDEAWLELQRATQAERRRRTGYSYDRAYARARNTAAQRLIENHRAEFDRLLLLARRCELETQP